MKLVPVCLRKEYYYKLPLVRISNNDILAWREFFKVIPIYRKRKKDIWQRLKG